MNIAMKTQKQTGFTIVELLIVIVVIGILAAITIVAYNGIQQRAKNAQVISGTRAYITAIQQYATLKSEYPSHSGCLGDNYPDNRCWRSLSNNQLVNESLDDELETVMSSKPTLATELFSIGIGDNMRAGTLYSIYSSPETPRLVYYLKGINQQCLPGHTANNEGGLVTQCQYIFPAL